MVLPTLSLVEYKNLKFLIFEAPSRDNIQEFIQEFKKYNVKNVVRACENVTYSFDTLAEAGITGHNMAYPDGTSPSDEVIDKWLHLAKEVRQSPEPSTIGIHCVAGLGRAPVLVAIALIEAGMKPLDAVALIRSKRKGAINTNQLAYLQKYTPRHKKCVIM